MTYAMETGNSVCLFRKLFQKLTRARCRFRTNHPNRYRFYPKHHSPGRYDRNSAEVSTASIVRPATSLPTVPNNRVTSEV